MKVFLAAVAVAIAFGVVAHFAAGTDRLERPVAEVFATQGVRL